MTVEVLCATRGRPERARAVQASVFATSRAACRFYVDDDDPSDYAGLCVERGPRLGPPRSFARLAASAIADYVVLVDDGSTFETPGWDEVLTARIPPDQPWVVAFHTGADEPKKTGEFALTRAWYTKAGAFPTIYRHHMADIHLRRVAKMLGRYVSMFDVMLRRPQVLPDDATNAATKRSKG